MRISKNLAFGRGKTKIVTFPNPVLRKKARALKEVTSQTRDLIAAMLETMYTSDPPGVGLAAPQVGISLQVIVIDIGNGPLAFINPKVLAKKGRESQKEGCLSFPGIYAEVERAPWIKVKALNKEGKPIELEADGLLARALQHEIDHLHGILFIDKITDWANLEIVDGYSLPEELKEKITQNVS